jgi:MscS family membrane protein
MLTDFLDDNLGEDASALIARAIVFAVLLLLTWLVRELTTAVLPRFIKRFTSRTENRLDDQIIEAARPPLRFLITVYGAWMAILSLEPSDSVRLTFAQIIDSLVAFGIFWAIYRAVDPAVYVFSRLSRRTISESVPTLLYEKLSQVLRQVAKGLVMVLGFAAIIEAWGYDIAGLIAGLGLAGAAVALAIKDTLANLLGYFVILADEPFEPGEYVVFDGISGTVEHIGFRSTRIRALDQSLVTVPNNNITNANITNWSRLEKRRLNMTLGLEYHSSSEQILSVVQAIRQMLENHEQVQSDSVIVQFIEFNESSLDIMIICFMTTPVWGEFQAARQDINFKIMEIVDERGVGLAFPSRTLYIQELPPASEALARDQVEALAPVEPEPSAKPADSPVPDDAAN